MIVRRKRSQEGFSLVELLVVVGIIGILGVIAIPVFRKYQAKASQNSARISAKIVYKAIAVCLSDGGILTDCAADNVQKTIDQVCKSTLPADVREAGCQITHVVAAGGKDDAYCVAIQAGAKQYCVDNDSSNDATKQDDSSTDVNPNNSKKCNTSGECVLI